MINWIQFKKPLLIGLLGVFGTTGAVLTYHYENDERDGMKMPSQQVEIVENSVVDIRHLRRQNQIEAQQRKLGGNS